MFRIRRFSVIKTANVVAFLYLVMIVVVFVPLAVIVALVAPNSGLVGNAGAVAVLFVGLLAAVFYGIIGWISTAIACLLYNFAARTIGGIEVQVEAVQPPTPALVWGTPPNAPPNAPPSVPPTTGPPPN